MNLKSYVREIIPPKYIYKLLHLKKTIPFLGGAATKSYSGNGEDTILLNYLFKNRRRGFYVDVGSFHPKIISNTYLLHHKLDWRGINIDPNPETQKLFEKYRPDDINLCSGVSEKDEVRDYYKFSYSGANTFDETFGEEKSKKHWNTLLSKEKLPCKTLKSIFQEHVPTDVTIDLLDVDVEGLDLKVLRSNDWRKYRPSVVIVEDKEFRKKPGLSSIFEFLEENGYKFHSYLDITLVMTEQDFRPNSN